MEMHQAHAMTLPASRPIPFLLHCWGKPRHGGTLPGPNNCQRPTHVLALPFLPHCKTHPWGAAATPLSSMSRHCRTQRGEEPCPSVLLPDQLQTGQHRARVSPLLCPLFLPAACTEKVQRSRMPCGPQPCRPGCVRAHTRAKKPPVISFTSAVPRSSSRERPCCPPKTRGAMQNHCLGSSPLSPHGEGWGARTFPGGHDSFPAPLRNSRFARQLRGVQRRRSRDPSRTWLDEGEENHTSRDTGAGHKEGREGARIPEHRKLQP